MVREVRFVEKVAAPVKRSPEKKPAPAAPVQVAEIVENESLQQNKVKTSRKKSRNRTKSVASHKKPHKNFAKVVAFIKRPKHLIVILAVICVGNVLIQLCYPQSKLLPNTFVAGHNFSFSEKSFMIDKLNETYNQADIDIFLGEATTAYMTVKPSELGVNVANAKAVGAIDYPWYMRLVPTSILWYGFVYSNFDPEINLSETHEKIFVTKVFGNDCSVDPVNAGLALDGTNLKLIPAKDGGTCEKDDVFAAIANINFLRPDYAVVKIDMDTIAPKIGNDKARALASTIGTKFLSGLDLQLGEEYETKTLKIESSTLASWIEFEVVDDDLTVVLNKEKTTQFFSDQVAPIVSREAGISVITANNLGDVSREDGAVGKMINVEETNQRITDWLIGKRTSVDLAIQSIDPSIKYARNFDTTNDGISSYIKTFVQTHNGRYGVQFVELGGLGRQANYFGDREFDIDGASRMILGYTMLTMMDDGQKISNNNNDTLCLNNVIYAYNTDCISSSVYAKLRSQQQSMGINNTTISAGVSRSTASDLATFLMRVYNGQLGTLTQKSRLFTMLKSSQPRAGIAHLDKNMVNATGSVGEQYSDAALVDINGHAYILVILVDGASMSDVIELADQINDFVNR